MNPASAKTSLNQIPALHRLTASLGLSTFDFGAGKKGKIDDFYSDLGIRYLPYDPFNRTNEENDQSINSLEYEGTAIATCANVLNVIEDSNLAIVISRLHHWTMETTKGICFVSVYHKPSLPINRQVNGHFQRNQSIDWYIPHLKKCFSRVEKQGKLLCCYV